LTVVALLIRIRFPTKNIEAVINRHMERIVIGMANQVKRGLKRKRQGGKGSRSVS